MAIGPPLGLEGAKGIKREPVKAVGCYMKAPKNPKAQWRLGMLLVRGEASP